MGSFVRSLASVKLAIVLVTVLVVALAAGTIVESGQGRDQAMERVYAAGWFRLLLVALALNLTCSLVDRWPWRPAHAGYLMTHGGMLVILAGALVTDQLKIEGVLPLWEGEQASAFELLGPRGESQQVDLGFAVRLDAFEIDRHPGTESPSMFRSRVTVSDPTTGDSFAAAIEMNRELDHGGFKLFQSSYRIEGAREQTFLSVSRDPGQPVVFAGYLLLVAGMLTTLGRRMAASAARAQVSVSRVPKPAARRAAAAALAFVTAQTLCFGAGVPLDPGAVDALRSLAVQHDGRIMPLDTVAREAVWRVTGQRSWLGRDPVATALGWSFDPERSVAEALIPIDLETALALGVSAPDGRASFRDLATSPRSHAAFERARREAAADRRLSPELEQARDIEERLMWMQPFLDHSIFRVLSEPGQADARWSIPAHLDDPRELLALAASPPHEASRALLASEVRYNGVRPTRLAWWILVPATFAAVAAWLGRSRLALALAMVGLTAGFAVMSWGLAVRWAIAGRIPASNMYESLLFLGWGVALFALVALVFLRNRLVVLNATAMAALTMLLTDRLPVDPFVHPMPPVLSGTPWLAIHVPIIMISYSVLALGVLVAHMRVGVETFAPSARDTAARLDELHYWYILIGSILLVTGMLTGSIWAASSWGRYWGWDPKEVWSLIAFLAYMAILHGRFERFIGGFGVAVLSIAAFWTILMTYLGVNFILAAGLHSYGFGGSSVARWMVFAAAVELAFLGMGLVAHRKTVVTAH